MRILILAISMGLVGCASDPSSSGTETASIAPPVGAEQQESAEANGEAAAGDKRAFEPPPGYKTKILDWDILYCRKAPVLGSRLPKEVCMTESQLKEHIATTEALREEMDQRRAICGSAVCTPQ
jgi:hypothetical protein